MKDLYKYFDKITFLIYLMLMITGIVMIKSAASGLTDNYGNRQILWALASVIAFFIFFKLKTEMIFRFAFAAYALLVVALAIQIIAGEIVSGTKSWIKTGFFSIQISEFIKIPVALYLAKTLTKFPQIQWKNFFKILIIVGIPFLLIALQPDLGTASMLGAFVLFSAVIKKIKPIIIIVSLLVVAAGFFTTWNLILKPYQRDRIISFLNPEKYKQSTGYQIIQSKIAIGSGGLTGKGYRQGTQSQFKFLPTRHTDFIISVIGEELGFLGISYLFILFFSMFYRQFNCKTESDEELYYVILFTGIILFQFLVNILMTIGFLPVLGIPLPFISYGGSSLLAFSIGLAIIFRIKINNYLNEY